MATQWQGPHFIAIAAAAALAFGGGYMLAGRSRPPAISTPPVTNTANGMEEPGIPGFDTNEQGSRGRPDENELIARNAEPPEGSASPQGGGNSSSTRPPAGERRPAPPREQAGGDKPPPSDPDADDQGFDPDDR